MTKNKIFLPAVLASCFILSGCFDDTPSKAIISFYNDAVSSVNEMWKSSPIKEKSASMANEKMNAVSSRDKKTLYIKCINGFATDINSSIISYINSFKNFKVGPAGGMVHKPSMISVDYTTIKECQSKINKYAISSPKPSAIDDAAQRYINAAVSWMQLFKVLAPYYNQEDFLDDDFAKAIKMHSAFYHASLEFVVATDDFTKKMNEQVANSQEELLARLEKQNVKNVGYYKLSLMVEGNKLVDFVGATNVDTKDAFILINDFTRKIEEAKTMNIALEEGKQSYSLKSITEAATTFNGKVKIWVRLLRNKNEKKRINNDDYEEAYDDVITSYNRMVWLFNS